MDFVYKHIFCDTILVSCQMTQISCLLIWQRVFNWKKIKEKHINHGFMNMLCKR